MLILLTIFLFIFISLAMLILRLVRPRFSIQGVLVVSAMLAGLVMISLARSEIHSEIILLHWLPEALFPVSPSLLVDNFSWYLALGLMSFSFALVITSIAQIGQSRRINSNFHQINAEYVESTTISEQGSQPESINNHDVENNPMPNWILWIVILILTSLGLVAVTAGNLVTLLLAWAALDLIELTILIGQTLKSEARERAVIVFSAKLGGIVMLLIAGLMLWSNGGSYRFDTISPSVRIFLILAAAIRLGVLPPLLPHVYWLPGRQDLGTALDLIPAAASFILLLRVSSVGITGKFTPYLLAIIALVGLIAAIKWLIANNELLGRQYWMLGASTLAIIAAISGQPYACLIWSTACLLGGGLIFSMNLHHRNLIPLMVVAVFNISAFPFSPTWQGLTIYQPSSAYIPARFLLLILPVSYFIIQSNLIAGYIRHLLRGLYPISEEISLHIEKWVWVLFPLGLVVIVATHLVIGWLLLPDISGLPLYAWVIGPFALLFSAFILFILWRYPESAVWSTRLFRSSYWNSLFSFEWLYNLIWNLYRVISRLFALISNILEGDGGILWALVLFALIFVFLQY